MEIPRDLYENHSSELFNVKMNIGSNVYHYTSPLGLKSIIENKLLWFSNSEYLNDEQEICYAFDLVKKVAKEIEKLDDSVFIKWVIKYCNAGISKKNKFSEQESSFIACFSEQSDILSLWNQYTKNENSIGYSIGFDRTKLYECINKAYSTNFCARTINGKVIYDNNKQIELIKNALCDFNNKYSETKSSKTHNLLKNYFGYLIDIYSLFFKHPSFKDEKEYRIIIIANNTQYGEDSKFLKTRCLNGFFIPYYEKKFNKDIINSITLSPNNKADIIKKSVRELLRINKYDIPDKKIKSSDIPLRY